MKAGLVLIACAGLAGCSTHGTFVTEHPVNAAAGPLQAGVYALAQVDVPPVATHEVEPEFPPELGSIPSGQAVVAFTVRADGKVADPAILNADDILFGEAAVAAISKWRFRPARLKGVAVACRMTTPFMFDSPYGIPPDEGPPENLPSNNPFNGSRPTSVIPR